MIKYLKTYLTFLTGCCVLLFISCTADFRTDIEGFVPDVIIDDPSDDSIIDEHLYDPNLTVQENLDNGIPVLEILNHVPVSELYCLKYAGGLIYHVNSTDGSGLVVTEVDLDTMAYFGCKGLEISGADGTAIGTGMQNTLDIIKECNDANNAANQCNNLILNGYEDWFLPSIQEYQAMRTNLYKNNCAGFGNLYTSSSEYTPTGMWYISMIEDDLRTDHKDVKEYHIRASRAF